ncbi:hypothetical protein B2J88_08060 [Rhodococcus sp. SRB_17]|nr:hypothetical protein [Rhodococcus sp. SRB_17]
MTQVRAPDTVELLEALAGHLDDSGLARYAAIYSGDGLPAIYFGSLPDKPDTAILLNVYNEDRSRDDATPDYYVQIRYRTAGRDPRAVELLADAVFRHLHDQSNVAWGGVNVLLCRRILRAPTAPDSNLRYTRPDSYRITTNPGETT